MAAPTSVALLDHFAALPDPRQHAKVLYPLMRARIVGRPRNHLNRAVGHRQSRQPPCSLLWEEQSGVSGELRFVRYRRRHALKPARWRCPRDPQQRRSLCNPAFAGMTTDGVALQSTDAVISSQALK